MSLAETAPLVCAMIFYALAAVFYHGRWPLRGDRASRWGSALVLAGLVAHGSGILIRAFTRNACPLMELGETVLLVGWTAPAAYLLLLRGAPPGLGVLCMGLPISDVLAVFLLPPRALEAQLPVGAVFMAHIGLGLLAYAAFGLAACCAAAYLVQEALLKRKRFLGFSQRLPSLDGAEVMAYRFASLGFLLWTVMIAAGSVYAEQLVGAWWSWTPKETWSLLTWVLYAAYLHLRMVGDYRGRRTILLLLGGFLCLLATHLLANYLGDPFHG